MANPSVSKTDDPGSTPGAPAICNRCKKNPVLRYKRCAPCRRYTTSRQKTYDAKKPKAADTGVRYLYKARLRANPLNLRKS